MSKAANARYKKAHIKQYGFELNRNTDQDLIDLFEKTNNRAALIKRLLRLYLQKPWILAMNEEDDQQ